MTSQQKALVLEKKRGRFSVITVPVPTLCPGELLIKIESTALNPSDWKSQELGLFIEEYPAIAGTDVAGTVVALGEGVTGFVVGDKVFAEGAFDNRHATFQQYTVAAYDITAKIPDKLSFDEASTIPTCLATAALGLFTPDAPQMSIGLYPPWEDGGLGKYAGKPIVILGGASSVGQYVTQLAKLSGFSPIITTASLHSADLVKSHGATHVVDRRLPRSELISAVKNITSAPIDIVFDTISMPDTQNAGYELLAPKGTLLRTTRDLKVEASRETTDKKHIHVFGSVHVPPNRKISVSLFSKISQLLEDGVVTPNNVEVLPGGLTGIPDGLERLRKNQISGLKLVARPQETV